MAKLTNVKRIVVEDFPKDDQETISKLGFIQNNINTQLVSLFNKGISITDNLNMEISSVNLNVDANGSPTTKTQFKTAVIGSVKGLMVINAINGTNAATFPSQAPFISFTQSSGLITINNVTGLQANNNYTLTVFVIAP